MDHCLGLFAAKPQTVPNTSDLITGNLTEKGKNGKDQKRKNENVKDFHKFELFILNKITKINMNLFIFVYFFLIFLGNL